MDRQSLGNKVDICQIGSVGMYYHFYYIAFFLQVYKKKSMGKILFKMGNIENNWYEYDICYVYGRIHLLPFVKCAEIGMLCWG